MKQSYDYWYFKMEFIFNILKKLNLYNIIKIKGIIYKIFSNIAAMSTQDIYENKNLKIADNIIVSLTSFGKRTEIVSRVIYTLANQTLRPYKIILWLDKTEYTENNIPNSLKIAKKNISFLEIKYCDDIKSHKKYFYTMKEYPEYIIVTADDDVFYPTDWLENLYNCHKIHKDSICCISAHLITCDSNKNIQSYNKWEHLTENIGPNLLLCPIGVGGVLYPPHLLDPDVFDKSFIIKNCINADDLWLKIMSLIRGVSVVRVNKYSYTFLSIPHTQKHALSKMNVINNKNDEQLKNILLKYEKKVKERLCKE